MGCASACSNRSRSVLSRKSPSVPTRPIAVAPAGGPATTGDGSPASSVRVDGVCLRLGGRAPRRHELLCAALVERLRRSGLTTTLWHEEREGEFRALVALEPAAICTNTPAVLRRIVDKHCVGSVAVIEP